MFYIKSTTKIPIIGNFLPFKRTRWEKRIPFKSGNRFSLLQRPRSQDISGIPSQRNNIHDSVDNDSHMFSPKRKLIFGRKRNLVLEEKRHISKFLDNSGDVKSMSTKDTKLLFKSKVFIFHIRL